ncbi:hypothetical protein DYB31_007198, partial [Aphanomyces astaci]
MTAEVNDARNYTAHSARLVAGKEGVVKLALQNKSLVVAEMSDLAAASKPREKTLRRRVRIGIGHLPRRENSRNSSESPKTASRNLKRNLPVSLLATRLGTSYWHLKREDPREPP